jgi:hypothetical protein
MVLKPKGVFDDGLQRNATDRVERQQGRRILPLRIIIFMLGCGLRIGGESGQQRPQSVAQVKGDEVYT